MALQVKSEKCEEAGLVQQRRGGGKSEAKKATNRKKSISGRSSKTAGGESKSISLLEQVGAIMDSNNDADDKKKKKKKEKEKEKEKEGPLRRQTADNDSGGAHQPPTKRKSAINKSIPSLSPAPALPSSSEDEDGDNPKKSMTKKKKNKKARAKEEKSSAVLDFLTTLEAAHEDRSRYKLEEEEEKEMVDDNNNKLTKVKKQKKKLKKKLSASQQREIKNEMSKRKQKAKRKKEMDALCVEDERIEEVGWFNMDIKNVEEDEEEQVDAAKRKSSKKKKKKKKEKKKVLRSTVDYSRDYQFATVEQMEDKPKGYYQRMIDVEGKKSMRSFHIDNLFTTRRHLFPRVYHFENDFDSLNAILDKKEDRWWIESRLPSYEEDDSDDDEEDDGMAVLAVFFGPNQIERNSIQDDDSVIFSIASVESITFSDDDDHETYFRGIPREKIELLPGEFKIKRSEEETYEAITNGNYMSSLCLGCGVALVSVKDAREVACPTCGSITPLNGVCLHKPFGIATGVKRVKVEHLLKSERRNPFANFKPPASSTAVAPAPPTAAMQLPLVYKDMKVSELQRLCRDRGIDMTGMIEKKEMVDALVQNEKSHAAAETVEGSPESAKTKTNNTNNRGKTPKTNGAIASRTARAQATSPAKTKTAQGISGLRVRPSTSSSAAPSSRAPKPPSKAAGKTKKRPSKQATKPGAVRVGS